MLPDQKLFDMLSSDYAQVRIMALEQLRSSKVTSETIVKALEKATHDEDPEVAARANRALQADVHRQMAIKMGIAVLEEKEVEKPQLELANEPVDLNYHPKLNYYPKSQEPSIHIPDLIFPGYEEPTDNLPESLAVAASPPLPELKPRQSNRKEAILFVIGFLLVLAIIVVITLATLKKSTALRPGSAKAYYNLGVENYNNGDLDSAIKNFDQAITINPVNANSYNSRGIAYAKKGDLGSAISDFNQAVQIEPEYAGAYYNLGLAYANKGDLYGAIREWDHAIQIEPGYAWAYYYRGWANAREGQNSNAISDYNRAIAQCDGDTTLCEKAKQALSNMPYSIILPTFTPLP